MIDTKKMRELIAVATPLPWECEWNWELKQSVFIAWAETPVLQSDDSLSGIAQRARADKDYMEAACNALPSILDEVDALRTEVERLKDALEYAIRLRKESDA